MIFLYPTTALDDKISLFYKTTIMAKRGSIYHHYEFSMQKYHCKTCFVYINIG